MQRESWRLQASVGIMGTPLALCNPQFQFICGEPPKSGLVPEGMGGRKVKY